MQQDEPREPVVFQISPAQRAKLFPRLIWAGMGVYVLMPVKPYFDHNPQFKIYVVIAVVGIIWSVLYLWLLKAGKLKL